MVGKLVPALSWEVSQGYKLVVYVYSSNDLSMMLLELPPEHGDWFLRKECWLNHLKTGALESLQAC